MKRSLSVPLAMMFVFGLSGVLVTRAEAYNVTAVDAITNSVIATIPVDQNPFAVAVNPFTGRIYVTNNFGVRGDIGDGIVSVIDGATNTVVDRVHVGTNPSGVAVDPSTNRV